MTADWTLTAVRTPKGLTVTGEVDLDTAPQLEQAVRAACLMLVPPAEGPFAFLLDMSEVTFIDTSGLYALSSIHSQLDYRGWQLRLTPPSASGPRRLFLLAARRGWLPRNLPEPTRRKVDTRR